VRGAGLEVGGEALRDGIALVALGQVIASPARVGEREGQAADLRLADAQVEPRARGGVERVALVEAGAGLGVAVGAHGLAPGAEQRLGPRDGVRRRGARRGGREETRERSEERKRAGGPTTPHCSLP
jgi:hypothetical protein